MVCMRQVDLFRLVRLFRTPVVARALARSFRLSLILNKTNIYILHNKRTEERVKPLTGNEENEINEENIELRVVML